MVRSTTDKLLLPLSVSSLKQGCPYQDQRKEAETELYYIVSSSNFFMFLTERLQSNTVN